MAPIQDPIAALDEWFKKQEELAQQVQVVDDYIVVSVNYEYNIPLSECDTHEEIIKWAWQLSEKKWASKEVVMMFIRVACTHHHLEYRL